MSRILVIDDDINLLQMVRLMLQRVGHTVETSNDGAEGITLAAKMQPDLAIIDVMMPGLSGYDVVRKLREDPVTQRVPIIILTARSQPMDKHMALEAGANAFLSKPVTAQELTDRVDAVLKAGVNYRVHTGLLTEPSHRKSVETKPPSPPPDASQPRRPAGLEAPAAPPPADASSPRPPQRRPIGAEEAELQPQRSAIIVVMGWRGGTGSTTMAVNLAFLLASRGRRVCMVDLSTIGGHVSLHLHLAPPQHWGQLLDMGDTPDARTVNGLLVQHHGSGIHLLNAPSTPIPQTMSSAAMQAVLKELSPHFHHVIVDAPILDAAAMGAIHIARSVVLVMSDDPASVQTAAQSLNLMQKWGVDMARVRVALNHVRPTNDVPAETIQKAIKRPLSTEQMASIRRGVPLVMGEPQGAFALAVQQLANTMVM